MPVDPHRLAETLARLVSIESVNPSLVEGAPGETAIATFVAGQLTELGLDVALHEHAPGRLSVVGRLTGAGGRSLMLNAHTDRC